MFYLTPTAGWAHAAKTWHRALRVRARFPFVVGVRFRLCVRRSPPHFVDFVYHQCFRNTVIQVYVQIRWSLKKWVHGPAAALLEVLWPASIFVHSHWSFMHCHGAVLQLSCKPEPKTEEVIPPATKQGLACCMLEPTNSPVTTR